VRLSHLSRLLRNEPLSQLNGARVGVAPLKKVRQPLGLVGAEADHGARLSPRLAERVAHITYDRLSRCLPEALKRSPTLPG
jgi:hypothetical protein